jgi:hypothetical protein
MTELKADPAADSAGRADRRSLKPLLALVPYVARYRGRIVAAIGALTVAAMATLAVPLAVRRMIDFGFAAESAELDERAAELPPMFSQTSTPWAVITILSTAKAGSRPAPVFLQPKRKRRSAWFSMLG